MMRSIRRCPVRFYPTHMLTRLAREYRRGVQLANRRGHKTIAIAVKGQMVGYLAFKKTPFVLYLSYIYIGTRYRRKGVAYAALKNLLPDTYRLKSIVPENNLPAQLLLKKLGLFCERIETNPEGKTFYHFVWENG